MEDKNKLLSIIRRKEKEINQIEKTINKLQRSIQKKVITIKQLRDKLNNR